MKRIFYYFFSFSLLFNTILFAQSITWQRVLDNNHGGFKRVQQTYDGGYVAIGSDYVGNEEKIYLTKFNYLGNTLWTKIIGTGFTNGYWVEETNDKGLIISGSTTLGTSDSYAYLVKTDSSGVIQWQKTFSNSDWDFCCCAKQTPDNGYILVCRYFPFVVGTWFIKTDNTGNILWQKTYYNTNMHIKAFLELQILNDGYISVGEITEIAAQQTDAYVMRLNLNGDTLWTRKYGGSGNDGGYSIDKIGNSGFIIGGTSFSFNPNHDEAYLVRIDNSGNTIWQRTYSNNYQEYFERCYSVVYKPNTGIIMCGESDTTEIGNTNAIIRIVDSSGIIKRQKLFYPNTQGGWFRNVNISNDGGFIAVGTVASSYNPKMYIVKTDSMLEAEPIGIINGNENIPQNYILYQNYPNPFNSQTKINLELKSNAKVKIVVYDITGRLIKTLVNSDLNIGFHNFIFSTEDIKISSAVYFYSLYIDNSFIPVITRKLVYLK